MPYGPTPTMTEVGRAVAACLGYSIAAVALAALVIFWAVS
jgi:hypothetical protein